MPLVLPARRADGALAPHTIARAAELLRAGRLVAFPTETVYGLGANALDPAAANRVFAAKGRPSFNPLIVHVATIDAARHLASSWPDTAETLARSFWPGPLTLVLPKASHVPDEVTAGLPAVALRVPSHPVAHALLEACALPLAAPSANRSTSVSPTTAAHVVTSLGDRVDAVLDGGACAVGIESTVVDLTGPVPRLLRPGGISAEQLAAVVGPIERGQAVIDSGARVSPGLLAKHYAPDGATTLVEEGDIAEMVRTLPADARIGVIVRELARLDDVRIAAWERLGSDPESFARGIYAALHAMNAAGATHVLLARVPDDERWEAVTDRLVRAAGREEQ